MTFENLFSLKLKKESFIDLKNVYIYNVNIENKFVFDAFASSKNTLQDMKMIIKHYIPRFQK